MTTAYFPPLSENGLYRDDDVRWLGHQTMTFENIITGSLQAGNTLSSSNYVAGSVGWQIDGDGNAEFNNVTVRGDLVSGNWDGADPANLTSSPDGTATVGYYLDASAGAAQFEGSLYLGGDLVMQTGSTFKTAASGDRIEIGGDKAFISLYDSVSGLVGQIGWAATGYGADDLTIENASGVGDIVLDAAGALELKAAGSGADTVVVRGTGVGIPATVFSVQNAAGTSEYFRVDDDGNAWMKTAGSALKFELAGPVGLEVIQTGAIESALYYRSSPNTWGFEDNAGNAIMEWDIDTMDTHMRGDVIMNGNDIIIADGRMWSDAGKTGGSLLASNAGTWIALHNGNYGCIVYNGRTEVRQRLDADEYAFYGDDDTGWDNTTANQIGINTGGVRRGLWGTSGFHIYGRNADFFINDDFADIGNHETLRADRLSGSTPIFSAKVGYYSSWSYLKKYIKPVNDRKRWRREWFMDLEPVAYERRSTADVGEGAKKDPGFRQIELGFTIENLIENTNLLTTKGSRVGDSPDEYALLSVTVDYVQHLQNQVTALEERVEQLEGRVR